jgi:serine/threonine protein kinase
MGASLAGGGALDGIARQTTKKVYFPANGDRVEIVSRHGKVCAQVGKHGVIYSNKPTDEGIPYIYTVQLKDGSITDWVGFREVAFIGDQQASNGTWVDPTEALILYCGGDPGVWFTTGASPLFHSIAHQMHCPFAKSASILGAPCWNVNDSLAANLHSSLHRLSVLASLAMLPASHAMVQGMPEFPDGFVLALEGDHFGHSVQHLARTVNRVLTYFSEHDPSGRRAMDEPDAGRSVRGWRFSFAGCGMFVSAFAPCYPRTHSRYQYGLHPNHTFILFQPDQSFVKHSAMQHQDKIHELFGKMGQPYLKGKNDIVKPYHELNGQPVAWWAVGKESNTQEERASIMIHDPHSTTLAAPFQMPGRIAELVVTGEAWLRETWSKYFPVPGLGLQRFDTNPGLAQGCRAVRRFMAATDDCDDLSAIFGLHGTTEVAAVQICDGGFNPGLRSTQTYGPGEYLAVHPWLAFKYSWMVNRKTNQTGTSFRYLECRILLVAASSGAPGNEARIRRVQGTSLSSYSRTVEGCTDGWACRTFGDQLLGHMVSEQLVVDNPVDLSKAFCLPLGILSVSWKLDECSTNGDSIVFDTTEKSKQPPEFIQRLSSSAKTSSADTVQHELELLRQELDVLKADKMAAAEQAKEAARLKEKETATLQSLDLQGWEVLSTSVKLVKVIGQGAYGDVQLVIHAGVKLAFKTIRAAGSQAFEQQAKATLKEAVALKEARHKNVIRLVGICVDDPHRLGLLMEYAAQGTLRNVLDSNSGMDLKRRRRLIRGILAGMAKLHSHQPKPILHGDVKASNVLVMEDGTPKLADFGLASGARSSLAGNMSMSTSHRGGGTPVYTAPELFAVMFEDSDDDSDEGTNSSAGKYTEACDVYSTGVLIAEVVTGQQPWQQTLDEWEQKGFVLEKIKRKLAKEVFKKGNRPALPSDCDPFLKSTIEQCWHQDAQMRPKIQVVLNEVAEEIDSKDPSIDVLLGMVDEYALPDVPGYKLCNLESSNFKREYDWVLSKPLEDHQKDRLLMALRRVIEGYCARNNIDQLRGQNFLQNLHSEWKLKDGVGLAAERLWTSAQGLQLASGQSREFCFIYSQVLREDPASLARSCAIIARALNKNLVAGRTAAVRFPENGECWRGGGFDDQHRDFFTVGKKYRVQNFLATSFLKSVAARFMFNAEASGFPVVQWQILLDTRADPQGEDSLQHRCKHVNFLRVTHVPGEEEYLFAAFSVFTVCEVVWSDNPTCQNPHRITIRAAIDNSQEPEDLPLAAWC